MKIYGFKLKDEGGEYTRWFSSNGKFTGKITDEMRQVVIAQKFLVFHQAYACAKASCKLRDIEFITLYEKDWKKVKHPILQLLKRRK
jgi:hypothetical protein